MPGISGGGLDDGAAPLEPALTLGGLDHAQPDPILDAAPRVERFNFGEDRRSKPGGDPVKPDKRRVSNRVQDAVQDLHW